MKKEQAEGSQTGERIGRIEKRSQGYWLQSADRDARRPYQVSKKSRKEFKPQDGDIVAYEINGGSATIRRIVAPANDRCPEAAIPLETLGIPTDFPPAVAKAAQAITPIDSRKGREDWRQIPFVTIDPPTAKDHDDAVHAEPTDDGGHIVRVAIADVAHYVRPGSEMDMEARERGNSVYFPGRVVPMLPERISNDLCSLREKQDRPALAVRMVFGKDGVKKSHSFHRVLMQSRAKLSYRQAQDACDSNFAGGPDTLMTKVLKPLWNAYAAMKAARERRQPLELDLPETEFVLDERGRVTGARPVEHLEAHRLIEECMVQANVAAAETLGKKKIPLLYRIHDKPPADKYEPLQEFLSTVGITLRRKDGVTAAVLNDAIRKKRDKPSLYELVNEVILRSQSQAEYNPANIGHFGLNLQNYAHFTSPIRRYADLTVHRGLITALKLGDDGLPADFAAEVGSLGAELGLLERRALDAERQTRDRLALICLERDSARHLDGRVTGVINAGLFVRLGDYGADGFMPARNISGDWFNFDEKRRQMVGERSGRKIRLGDSLRVRVEELNPAAKSCIVSTA